MKPTLAEIQLSALSPCSLRARRDCADFCTSEPKHSHIDFSVRTAIMVVALTVNRTAPSLERLIKSSLLATLPFPTLHSTSSIRNGRPVAATTRSWNMFPPFNKAATTSITHHFLKYKPPVHVPGSHLIKNTNLPLDKK